MNIIIVCWSMEYLSGSSLYNYTLAKELMKDHEVDVLSNWSDKFKDLNRITRAEKEYDLALISHREFPMPKANKIINIIHSEYEGETPIIGLDHYIAIRPEIKEHLIKEHRIPADKIRVIYNGVDLERFKPRKKTKRNYTKVVIPATRDHLRKKFFEYYIEKANKDFRVYIYGKDNGYKIPEKEYVYVNDQVDNIEDYIGDADLVAGILLGRVNLEARAMDVKSRIHNPEKPEEFEEFYPPRDEFEKRHDIKNVAKQLLNE